MFSDVVAIYKFYDYYDNAIALVQVLFVFFLLPFATLTYTEGHHSQTVD